MRWKQVLSAFFIGCVLTAGVSRLAWNAFAAAGRTNRYSQMSALAAAVWDIRKTLDRGERQLAADQLKVLFDGLIEYTEGGPSPEAIAYEVKDLSPDPSASGNSR